MFYEPAAQSADEGCCSSVQYGLFDHSPCQPLDGAWRVARQRRPPRSHCNRSHIGDRLRARTTITVEQSLGRACQSQHRQSHASLDQVPAKATAARACDRQMTTTHHILESETPFFRAYLDGARSCSIFGVHIGLEPRLGHTNHTRDTGQRNLF